LERLYLTGDAGSGAAPEAISVDRVLLEPWSATNLGRDGTTDTVLEGAQLHNSRISGVWTTTFVVQETTNIGMSYPGRTLERQWTLAEGACDGVTCPTSITSSSGWSGHVRHSGDALVSVPAVDLVHCYELGTDVVRVPEAYEQRSTYVLRVV